jgi:lipopolysaccharide/colanic/teichoic acid biosynthesis glycosyltransferase/HAMP domain-containing protein
LDVVWGGVSPLVAYLLRDGAILRPGGTAAYCGVAFLASFLVFQWFRTSSPISRFYSIRDAFELIKACVLITALAAVLSFLLTRLEEAPRSIPILHFMLLSSGLLGARFLLRLRDTHRETRTSRAASKVEHVLIIGATRLAWFFSKMLEELAPGGYQIVAILDENPRMRHRSLNGYPIIGAPTDLEKVIADYALHGVRIDKIVVAEEPQDLPEATWTEICRVRDTLKIGLEVLPERLMSAHNTDGSAAAVASAVNEMAAVPESEYHASLDRPFWKVKRALDFAIALVIAIVLSPVILIVSLLALFDVGIPTIFWQRRVGRNGVPLHLYKFRTLKTLFDRQTKEKREAHDPSAIGRFLRATRLDELPQLWNVLAGEMSLVGPRPLLPVDQPQGPTLRLTVRPGVTGWAQICGGNAVSVEEKNALDEWYIRHASLRLDLLIVYRTVGVLLRGDRRNEKAIAMALLERSNNDVNPSPATSTDGASESLMNLIEIANQRSRPPVASESGHVSTEAERTAKERSL